METDRRELEGALRALKGAVASRPGIPALTGVLVEGDGAGRATLTATDLETTATARIAAGEPAETEPEPCAHGLSEGEGCKDCARMREVAYPRAEPVDEPSSHDAEGHGEYERRTGRECPTCAPYATPDEPEGEPAEDPADFRERVTRAAEPGEEIRRRLGRADDSAGQWAELADVGTVAGAGRSAVRVRVVAGPDGSPMVDARRFIDSARYSGPTRKGFALRPAEAGQLAELLRDAQAAAEAWPSTGPGRRSGRPPVPG